MKKTEQSGFSLLEVMIVTVILIIVLGGIFEVLLSGLNTYNESSIMTEVHTHARRIIDSVANEIQGAGLSTIYPIPPESGTGTSTISFQTATGYSAGAIQWSDVITISFEYEAGESDNGADDNGNGLIDEGVVKRTVTDSGGGTTSKILGHWVEEDGLSFNLRLDVLTIALKLKKKGYKGDPWTTTLTTAVQIKNP